MSFIAFIIIFIILTSVSLFFLVQILSSLVDLFITLYLIYLFFKNRKRTYVLSRSLDQFHWEWFYLRSWIYGHPFKFWIGIFSKKGRDSLWVE